MSSPRPRKLGPRITSTEALPDALPDAQSRVSSPARNSSQPLGATLLAGIRVFGASFPWRLSTAPEMRSVRSLSKTHLPTSSMIRQDGLASVPITPGALPRSTALERRSPGSVALRQCVSGPPEAALVAVRLGQVGLALMENFP